MKQFKETYLVQLDDANDLLNDYDVFASRLVELH